jgi:hypothetical protein
LRCDPRAVRWRDFRAHRTEKVDYIHDSTEYWICEIRVRGAISVIRDVFGGRRAAAFRLEAEKTAA